MLPNGNKLIDSKNQLNLEKGKLSNFVGSIPDNEARFSLKVSIDLQ